MPIHIRNSSKSIPHDLYILRYALHNNRLSKFPRHHRNWGRQQPINRPFARQISKFESIERARLTRQRQDEHRAHAAKRYSVLLRENLDFTGGYAFDTWHQLAHFKTTPQRRAHAKSILRCIPEKIQMDTRAAAGSERNGTKTYLFCSLNYAQSDFAHCRPIGLAFV